MKISIKQLKKIIYEELKKEILYEDSTLMQTATGLIPVAFKKNPAETTAALNSFINALSGITGAPRTGEPIGITQGQGMEASGE